MIGNTCIVRATDPHDFDLFIRCYMSVNCAGAKGLLGDHKETDIIEKEEITVFTSLIAAQDQGWRKTNLPGICPEEKDDVWICPQCAEILRK